MMIKSVVGYTIIFAVLFSVADTNSSHTYAYQFTRTFTGLGPNVSYHDTELNSETSLGLTARHGELGIVGAGIFTNMNYRLDSRLMSGGFGVDLYISFVGGYTEVAWIYDGSSPIGVDLGLGYGLKILLPTRAPMFFKVGGKAFIANPTEFNLGFSISFPLGRALKNGF